MIDERPMYTARFRHHAVGLKPAARSVMAPENTMARVSEPRLLARGRLIGNPVARIWRKYGLIWTLSRLGIVVPVRIHQGTLVSARKNVTMEAESRIGSIFLRNARVSFGIEVNRFFP